MNGGDMHKKTNCSIRRVAHSFGKSSSKSKGLSGQKFINENIGPITSDIRGLAPQISGINLPSAFSGDEFFDLQSQRLLETIRPGLAARGFLTSGTGQNVENQAIEELLARLSPIESGLQLQEAQFAQTGKIAETSTLVDLLRTILGQTTTAKSGSVQAGINI